MCLRLFLNWKKIQIQVQKKKKCQALVPKFNKNNYNNKQKKLKTIKATIHKKLRNHHSNM